MSAFFGEDYVGLSQNNLPSHSPNSSGPPSDEPPQRRREPWSRKEKIAAGAVAATLLAAIPSAIALLSRPASTVENSSVPAEAPGKRLVEPSETPSNTTPSKLSKSGLIVVTDPDNNTEMCVDADTNKGNNRDAIQLWVCRYSGKTEGQLWTLYPDKTVRALEKCLDIVDNSSEIGARLHLWDCNGVGGQQWIHTDGNELKNPQSGLCLEVPGGIMVKDADLQMNVCSGAGASNGNGASLSPKSTEPFAQRSDC